MGEKLGLNGVDNGYPDNLFYLIIKLSFINLFRVMMFDHFRVPRVSLLNRTGDVNESGIYVSPFKDKKKRLGKGSYSYFVKKEMIYISL